MKLAFSRDAEKTLARMPANTRRLIVGKIEQYATDPASLANNVKTLKGPGGYLRLRVGDWRVVFREDGAIIAVIRISRAAVLMTSRGMTMTKQTILAPNGERMIVLEEAEYERLLDALEDAQDEAAVRRFKEKLAAGEEELIPAEYVYRLLDGENRVAVWREYRGMTAKELAESAGITQGYLSQLETGKRDGTVGTMKKIAEALKLTIDDLV